MNYGSLFTGIGGLDLGLEMCGIGPALWQAESDPFCLRVLSKRWPNVRRFIDVRLIDDTTDRVDVICGGFPCQDISVAGKGAGLEGARSGLWSEYARIIRVLRPRVVFVENVAALVNRGLDRVLGDLAAFGFYAEWDCFRASDVGAPHRRARLFLLAYANGDALRELQQRLPGRRPRGVRDEGQTVAGADGDDVADADSRRLEGIGDAQRERERASRDLAERRGLAWVGFPPGPAGIHDWDGPKPAVRRGADGTADRLDRLRALGNAVVPQVAALAWRTLLERAAKT